jgi:hypothetical protein
MKGIVPAVVLASLQALSTAQAYESDIHYSATFVLARAVGWSEADARIIASANEGVDQNEATVAALEMEGLATGSLRQAEKNFRFHCFSATGGEGGRIAADVREVMAGRFAGIPGHAEDAAGHTRRLIALGVALHCQQDAHAHVDFGGSCGAHRGNCYGHTHQNLLDQVAFRLLGRHYFNPDHPAVSGGHLLETLEGTVRELQARRPGGAARFIPARDLIALSNALRASGIELPDDVRMECNRHIAGQWLFDFLRAGGRARDVANASGTLAPGVARTCGNPSLASAAIAKIPAPRFPLLDADASPMLVRADGGYRSVDAGVSLTAQPGAAHAHRIGHHDAAHAKVQLSHWRQLLALPPIKKMRVESRL